METSDKARAAAVKHLETRQKLAKDRIKKRLANRRSVKHVSKEKEVCSVQTLSSALETPETGGAGIRPNKAAVAATTTGASNSTGTTTAAAAAAAEQPAHFSTVFVQERAVRCSTPSVLGMSWHSARLLLYFNF